MSKTPLISDAEDLALFYSLCEQYGDLMMSAAKTVLTGRNACYVDDAIQNACISIARNINTIKLRIPCEKRRNFVVRIVKNAAVDIVRKENREESQSFDDIEYMVQENAPDPLDVVISKESYENILNSLRGLNETYRSILELKLLYELTVDEIASILNISPINAKMRLYRAKKKLRDILRGRR